MVTKGHMRGVLLQAEGALRARSQQASPVDNAVTLASMDSPALACGEMAPTDPAAKTRGTGIIILGLNKSPRTEERVEQEASALLPTFQQDFFADLPAQGTPQHSFPGLRPGNNQLPPLLPAGDPAGI